jgi:dipeptidyl aminopeptidase/acylaminoacyl peptidase
MRWTRSVRIAAAITLLVAPHTVTHLVAQDSDGKRAMRIEDYARWRSIVSVAISDDGTWMTYGYRHHRADDTLYVRNLDTDREFLVPRGSDPKFSDDSRWVAYIVSTTFDDAEKLRRDKKPVPRRAGLMNLATGDTLTWDNVGSFEFSKGADFLAIKKVAADDKAEHKGTDLILRNLAEGYDELIGNVGELAFNKPGTHLAHIVDAAGRSGNGLYLYELDEKVRRVLDNDTLLYAKLTWDEEGTAVAVLKGTKDSGLVERGNSLVAFTDVGASVQRSDLEPALVPGFPAGMVVSEKSALSWSEDLSLVFFGIKRQEEAFEEDEDNPTANVDIFHWGDDRIQTVQERRAQADRNFTYQAAFSLRSGDLLQLTDSTMRYISLTRDGKWGIGRDDRAYISDWEETRADYYRVNTSTGERDLMFEGQKRTLGLSPDSKHFLYWKDGHIWDYAIQSGATVNLTETAPVSFINEQWDYPSTKPPYGVAGWTKDGRSVVLNHRYDLWLQPLDGESATMLTEGEGDAGNIRFRYVRLDPEERFIDLSEPIILSAYGDLSKRYGYYELDGSRVRPLIFDDRRAAQLEKAKNADRVLFTVETFVDFPNYHMSDASMSQREQVTDANPWQSEYRWGYNILIEYENKDGVPLQGVLSVPDDYEPGQRLPMLVDFYEKRSQELYRYSRLVFRDTPMFAKYVSNGYLVLLPDVHFNTGTTHDDMLDCVEAATRKVIELGYADPEKIGLHGHSFSGGGASFIATRSNMFASIVAGAAPINLAGEFNILFHGSGQNNHRYDIYSQGRYGTNPFDDFDLYRSQSPITWVKTMDTPLLYLHGTKDGSVEYLQGMEFYNALRFLGKPIIFASYPEAGHHLSKLENQKDFMTRMEQFYDHYLKGAPAPDWMVNGVPFLQKKKEARELMQGRAQQIP